ncbi:MAG: regulator [Nanopusillaceae archaeon]
MEIPLKPVGKEEIRKLESAILLMSLFDRETFENIRNPETRLTWIDSLYIAAAALARDKAGMPITQISDELGVTEMTIRKHLKGETKAGQIVARVYEKLSKEGFKLELPDELSVECSKKIKELEEKLELIKNVLKDLINKI